MMAGPIRPQKTALLVAQRIVADINRSGKRAGDRLPPEREMLETYQIGRATLREALRLLEFQGVISMRPGPKGGPAVEQPDSSLVGGALSLLLQFAEAPLDSVVESLRVLEPHMVRLAAERIDEKQLNDLAAHLDSMGDSLDDQERFLEERARSYEVLAEAAGNPLLSYLVDALWSILDHSVAGTDYLRSRCVDVHRLHVQMYEAITRGNPRAAAAAMEKHIDEFVTFAQSRYPELLNASVEWTG
ncbi:FadR family transcriptional regulator [Aeromicrobium phragmitis]|uniref:FadR family transcriptional regulator n=2 Tax=Aeromicrobium phragmitis TaxID=2478914 RepID=A0A3L8PU80_9ACTN|nr:FadR family transcriptional regulator [Aeromicrobium phragmitis]